MVLSSNANHIQNDQQLLISETNTSISKSETEFNIQNTENFISQSKGLCALKKKKKTKYNQRALINSSSLCGLWKKQIIKLYFRKLFITIQQKPIFLTDCRKLQIVEIQAALNCIFSDCILHCWMKQQQQQQFIQALPKSLSV